jgi:bifunctional N-acetylglucosamine-1-phosphate-uridyltransferase/glucosamine-1-phosphate-acetyltransferase GlmU-like protein
VAIRLIRSKLPSPKVTFVDQKEQLGTGHAVLAATEHFPVTPEMCWSWPGDVPLIGVATLESFARFIEMAVSLRRS